MVQKMLIHHQYTIEVMKESLGDSVIVALSSAKKCNHTDCVYPSTVKHKNCSSYLCDRHLAEKITRGFEKEEEWDDLHYAECIRSLQDYIEMREDTLQLSCLH